MAMLLLLALLAVGLLSLSTISLRARQHDQARGVARANARLALSLAIGQLQDLSGADTRITAPGDLLDDTRARGLGVWKSWEGRDHTRRGRFAGRPETPDYDAKRKSGSPAEDGAGRFLGWLATRQDGAPDIDAYPVSRERRSPGDIPMVGESSAEPGERVHVPSLELGRGAGALAWWVSGENQKARIQPKRELEDEEWALARNGDATPDPAVFRLLEEVEEPSMLERLVSRGQFDFARTDDLPTNPFHHLSTTSTGLLTNAATGGWRKDLTLLTQHWDRQSGRGLELFQVEPGRNLPSAKPSRSDARPGHSLFYWWADYRADGSQPPIYQSGPVVSWANLVDYCLSYRRRGANLSANGRRVFPIAAPHITDRSAANTYSYLHEVRMLPVIARIQWVYSLFSRPVDRRGHQLYVILNPVVTLWNPYDVELPMPANFRITLRKPIPSALQLVIDGTELPYRTILKANNRGFQPMVTGSLTVTLDDRSGLGPGATRVFSPTAAEPGPGLTAKPGYHPAGGYEMTVMESSNRLPLRLQPTARIECRMRFDAEYTDISTGTGIYLDADAAGQWVLAYRMTLPPSLVPQLYGVTEEFPVRTVAEVEGTPRPFASCIFGTRMASDTHLAAKGFVQSSPLVSYTATGNKSQSEHNISRSYNGAAHPVNSPFDFSFLAHTSLDNRLPNFGPDEENGYIVSGFDVSTGLARCAVASTPVRPLQSLCELQHWDLRYDNPVPPFAFNLIGNSDASPLFAPDAVVNPADANLTVNLQYDDSYCANHLLFDDWFFSSLYAEPDGWLGGRVERSEQEVFTDWFGGDRPLANAAYRFAGAETDPEDAYETWVAPRDAWKSLAACLEVDGMFNVNSTSVDAWRALLRHARDEKVPRIHHGANWSVAEGDTETGTVSRTTVATDNRAGTGSQCGEFPGASEFTGYRVFDDDLLDRLAERIVEQVRERGPFLSLSEFVNRQLSAGEPALAGAVQTALNQLSREPGSPFGALESLSTPASSSPPGAQQAGYRFPAAAEGYSGYGLPGWTRQADLLRPLAPTLSVRDDTFTIRAYGEARDSGGGVTARAWCEATVQRKAAFVEADDPPETSLLELSEVNRRFGRRYELLSFRWLSEREL